jgi:ATPase
MPEKYIVDLQTVSSSTLRDLIIDGTVRGKLYIHTGYFKNVSSEEELRSIAESIMEITNLSSLYEDVTAELISHIPKGLKIDDIYSDKNHFLISLAIELDCIIITSDPILAQMTKASRIKCIYKEPEKRIPSFTKYFTEDVMSLHLKEGSYPYVKRGKPGKWVLEKIDDKILTRAELENIAREIYEIAKTSYEQVKEIDRKSSLIAQLGHYRIVFVKPPLSDGMEITIVRPVKTLRLEDYKISERLMKRLEEQAEGILIAGAPGMGKTTFAQALAEFYLRKNKIVKTVESPRDMNLPVEITQYSKTHGTSEELHDILLLSRPDYTIFDEMRDTKDFELYTDLRLAGIGMVGVIHATTPIDAIQRFINRVELGMIPSIIDTVIFIKYGEINKVYTLETAVKVPHGLTEADLTRPVVLVKDFETEEPEYEIYVFGERTFVVPIKKEYETYDETKKGIIKTLRKYVPSVEIEVEKREGAYIVKVPMKYYTRIQHLASKKLKKIATKYDAAIEIIPI